MCSTELPTVRSQGCSSAPTSAGSLSPTGVSPRSSPGVHYFAVQEQLGNPALAVVAGLPGEIACRIPRDKNHLAGCGTNTLSVRRTRRVLDDTPSPRTDLALDALDMGLWNAGVAATVSPAWSITAGVESNIERFATAEQLAEADAVARVDSKGDSYGSSYLRWGCESPPPIRNMRSR